MTPVNANCDLIWCIFLFQKFSSPYSTGMCYLQRGSRGIMEIMEKRQSFNVSIVRRVTEGSVCVPIVTYVLTQVLQFLAVNTVITMG